MTERRAGLVRKGKPSPGPKVPPTRETMVALLKELAAHHSNEQAIGDLAAFLKDATDHARSILADRTVSEQSKRDHAQLLLDRIDILECGVASRFTSWGTEHYLLAAIDLGAFLHGLDGFYRLQNGRPSLYDRRHFDRMDELMREGKSKRQAAKQTLLETDRTLAGDQLANRIRGLCDAYDVSKGRK